MELAYKGYVHTIEVSIYHSKDHYHYTDKNYIIGYVFFLHGSTVSLYQDIEIGIAIGILRQRDLI